MNTGLQRLRAEVTSDAGVFESRLDELADLRALARNPGALAQAAVALHPARVEEVRSVPLAARASIRDDFRRLDDLLRELAGASA